MRCRQDNERNIDSLPLELTTQPPELLKRRVWITSRAGIAMMNILTALLLMISFAPFDCWFVGFVALTPWLTALHNPTRPKWSMTWSVLAGAAFWAASLYWLTWITLVGYFALLVVLTGFWLVATLVLRTAMRRLWPMWLITPVVWVGLEYARSWFLSGFPWFNLSQAMYSRTMLIQIADVTGEYGVSFFVGMVNGLAADLLTAPLFKRAASGLKPRLAARLGLAVTVVVAIAMLLYGRFRLGQHTTAQGPIVAVVQEAYPISLQGRSDSPGDILDSHLKAAQALAGARLDLLVLPETMGPSGINSQFLNLDVNALSDRHVMDIVRMRASMKEQRELLTRYIQRYVLPEAQKIEQVSNKLDAPVLIGAVAMEPNHIPVGGDDLWLRFNAALWFDRSWASRREYYSKIHPVPFSEYVPFKRTWPQAYWALRFFVPPVMEQLEPGSNLRLQLLDDKWRIATPICYEGTFARVCRKLVNRPEGRADIMINMSNDGWFVPPQKGGKPRGSTEHSQHLAHYVFRAIENRVPVVRAVNTGISASIDSNGGIVAQIVRDGRRTMVSGTLLLDGGENESMPSEVLRGPRVLVDARQSLYSRIGDLFAQLVSAAGVVLTAIMIFGRRAQRSPICPAVKRSKK